MLTVEEVHLNFREVHVLAGASLKVEAGETLGIIGPNGPSKNTLHAGPPPGDLFDQNMTAADSRSIVSRGLARTYQNKRLFGSLTVPENVLVPAMRTQPGSWLQDILGMSSGRQAAMARAHEWLAFFVRTVTNSCANHLPGDQESARAEDDHTCWLNRAPASRCHWPTGRICWRPGWRWWRGPASEPRGDPRVRDAYLGG
jgi:ABC-type branched-subunit amino acid transport system ATPase component